MTREHFFEPTVRTLLSSSNSMTFHDLFQVFQDLRFSCQYQTFKTFTCFRAFFDLKQFNRHKLWRSLKCVPFTLLNYSSLSYIVLALSSAVTNLSNKTLIFHDFQGPTIKSHDFPSLEMKFINSRFSMTYTNPVPSDVTS